MSGPGRCPESEVSANEIDRATTLQFAMSTRKYEVSDTPDRRTMLSKFDSSLEYDRRCLDSLFRTVQTARPLKKRCAFTPLSRIHIPT